MTETAVIDASIAVKWVVNEVFTQQALELRKTFSFVAPDLICAEWANVLWKKARRNELSHQEAHSAIRILALANIELVPMHALMSQALDLAIRLGHPAYDCMYLALASARRIRLITADNRLVASVRSAAGSSLADLCVPLGG